MSILFRPWGGNCGNHWDDGVHDGIREINLIYSSCIDSIRVTYDNNVKPLLAEKHGGMGGTKSAQLRFPEEVLISVSGHYCPMVYGASPMIRSLTLKTNQRIYGPFGVETGTPFNFLTNGGYIVGLYGRSGWFLDSLGFYVSPPKLTLFQRIQIRFKGFNHSKDGKHKEKQKARKLKSVMLLAHHLLNDQSMIVGSDMGTTQ
ncbi:jacalin-related lectin 19-like protein [Tanacetum coccineum]